MSYFCNFNQHCSFRCHSCLCLFWRFFIALHISLRTFYLAIFSVDSLSQSMLQWVHFKSRLSTTGKDVFSVSKSPSRVSRDFSAKLLISSLKLLIRVLFLQMCTCLKWQHYSFWGFSFVAEIWLQFFGVLNLKDGVYLLYMPSAPRCIVRCCFSLSITKWVAAITPERLDLDSQVHPDQRGLFFNMQGYHSLATSGLMLSQKKRQQFHLQRPWSWNSQ